MVISNMYKKDSVQGIDEVSSYFPIGQYINTPYGINLMLL